MQKSWRNVGLTWIALVLAGSFLSILQLEAADAAPSNTLTVQAVSARTEPRAFGGAGVTVGDPITDFEFLVNADNTGDTSPHQATGVCSPSYVPPPGEPGYPESCPWTSVNSAADASPIVAQGNQATLAGGLNLPDGRYLISMRADGYKLGGAHFTMPFDGAVQVELQPQPLPDSTVRGQVFEDMAPTNGAYDNGDQPIEGWMGHLNDLLGEVTTDVYGNPLCTTYVGEDPVTYEIPASALDGEMLPVVDVKGGECRSDADGVVTFPHMGTNRYTQFVTPPDGEQWIQTTTLEGNHDWDTWVMEGSTGYDTEFALAGEAVPTPLFGFAKPTKNGQPLDASAGGAIGGRVMRVLHYVPPKGGIYDLYNGYTGSKVDRPIKDAWLSLNDLQNGDQAVWVGQADTDGRFDISGVPAGDYMLTWWDEAQNHLIALQNVTVGANESVQLGMVPLSGWWTEYSGYVFNDKNRNGVRNAGENGISGFTLTMRKRDNSLMDRGQTTAVTDANGFYSFEAAYPLGEFGFTVMEAYSDSFFTTGVTYQADNQNEPTTVKGAGVDVSTLNIIGLGGTFDWGVHSYDASGTNGVDPQNGGIVGSISYDTTRNEFDPQYAAAEDWQPGVPDVPVKLYATVNCGTNPGTPCDLAGDYELTADGAYAKGALLNSYLSENWEKPTGCTARDLDGVPLVHGVDEDHLALHQEGDGTCIPAFSQSIQFGTYSTDVGSPDANFGAAVNGNYGFGDGCFNGTLDDSDPANPVCVGGDFTALGSADYLVALEIPEDGFGTPNYKVTGEEDINVANGNQIVPQVPPPPCAGALHTVDVADDGTDGYGPVSGDGESVPLGVTVPASTPVTNAPLVDMGGTPFEGSPEPTCGTKLVRLNNGKSIVPMFQIFTDVPVPSRLRGLIIDDINFSANPQHTAYGEKLPAAFLPIGIYDFSNRLVTTVESDFNGFYDVLLPSTDHISCPTPAGVCAGMYRFVGNDPGIPGRLNPNFNPHYRTIGTEFEALPGVVIPTDLAPTQVGVSIERPGSGQPIPVTCPVDPVAPQLLAVDRPFVRTGQRSITIQGTGFGASQGAGAVTLNGTNLPVGSWNNTQITVTVPNNTPVGPRQLSIRGSNGLTTVNGLTIHVLGGSYNPVVREVGPGRTYATIQAALDASLVSNPDDLVVVYPNTATQQNPRGAYYENVIMASPVKLQGVGAGGFRGSEFVPGTILDAGAFGGDTQLAADWYTKLGTLTWDGNQEVNDGEGIYLLASQNSGNQPGRARQFGSQFPATIDGFDLRGGNQQGFPGNISEILGGGPTGLPPNIQTQGGAIFANSYVRNLRITNNVVQSNGGAYGTIRIGTPDLPGNQADQNNENSVIANNRIIANAGSNLAGAVGLFGGSDNYEVADNDICGNFSLEYGAGISVYGRSPNGRIHDNRIYYNNSNDEGAGIMVAGALPANPNDVSPGTGRVDIYANQIQANLANDDGGGIRFLMAGTDQMNVYNNFIVNNVSTHEGGGISLNDATNVRIRHNTIMKNLTTATAVTSNGQPAPAGLSTSANSAQLQATLTGPNPPTYSRPVLFNNIFWDNRAGTRAGGTVTGIGLAGDATPVEHWDLGMFADAQVLAPVNSIVQQNPAEHPYTTSTTNSAANPQVISTYDVSVSFAAWRQNPAFVDATLVALEAPGNLLGNYHLSQCPQGPACNRGAANVSGVAAPTTDIDGDSRPLMGGYDAGADEYNPVGGPPGGGGPGGPGGGGPGGPGAAPVVPARLMFLTGQISANLVPQSGSAINPTLTKALTRARRGLSRKARVDGFSLRNGRSFYVSFATNTRVKGVGAVQDEDVVFFDGRRWSMRFNATAAGLRKNGADIDALHVMGKNVYFSIQGNAKVPRVRGKADDADVYRWNGTRFSRVWDASLNGVPRSANVDGLHRSSDTRWFLSFDSETSLGGVGEVEAGDVVFRAPGSWSLYYDGSQ